VFVDLTRRALVATLAAAPATEAGGPERAPGPVRGLFGDIPRIAAPAGIDVLQTSGHARPGLGAALYVATADARPSAWKARTADGRWFQLAEPVVTPEMLGALADGRTDDSAAIMAAFAAAEATGADFAFGPHTYAVASTLKWGRSSSLRGAPGRTVLRPLMNDGSPVIALPPRTGGVSIEDIIIEAETDRAAFAVDGRDVRNCTGIRIGEAPEGYGNRLLLKNVRCTGLAVGYDVTGYIIKGVNVWAHSCVLGWRGRVNNDVSLHLQCENNTQDFEFTGCSGLKLDAMMCEGGNLRTVPSTIDDCRAVSISSPYWEWEGQRRPTPYLVIGGRARCEQVQIRGGWLGCEGLKPGVPALVADKVDGLDIELWASTPLYREAVRTTAETRNYRRRLFSRTQKDRREGPDNIAAWNTDDSLQIGPAQNWFPNSGFDLWFRGWPRVLAEGAAVERETARVRRGPNALRVRARAGEARNLVRFQLFPGAPEPLFGRTVRACAWMWVPPETEVRGFANSADRALFPDLFLAFDDSGAGGMTPLTTRRALAGAWNFVHTPELLIPPGAARLWVCAAANRLDRKASGGEYVIFDSIRVVEAAVPLDVLERGETPDSPLIFAGAEGGRMRMTAAAPPSDPAQLYAAGDEVLNASPSPGEPRGWVCTTPGAGSQAVFSPWGMIGR
jgi:hypothetical protein